MHSDLVQVGRIVHILGPTGGREKEGKREREGGSVGLWEKERDGERETGRETGREEGREGERERERERERCKSMNFNPFIVNALLQPNRMVGWAQKCTSNKVI